MSRFFSHRNFRQGAAQLLFAVNAPTVDETLRTVIPEHLKAYRHVPALALFIIGVLLIGLLLRKIGQGD